MQPLKLEIERYGQQVSAVERVFTRHNRLLQRPKTLCEPQRSMTS